MLASFDLPTVRRYTEDLSDRARRCDNGEGTACSDLQSRLNHYLRLCGELRESINRWARAIYSGNIKLDPEVERLLKTEAASILRRAKELAAIGRAMDGACFVLEGLDRLHYYVADLDYLLENWVSPRLAVSPAPRLKVPEAADKEAMERLKSLSPSD